jgi:hypothetical protein
MLKLLEYISPRGETTGSLGAFSSGPSHLGFLGDDIEAKANLAFR